ncbi:MAG TPA: DUF1501 domain-containing protein [Prolixibacteraceae bacterium]|nr:DUF1501 domain-containing protein [Prolixibacteraceae bacterium]
MQLDGGNDGLNTIIPVDQYAILSQLRPEVVLPQEKIIALDTQTGIHPSMSELAQLYRDQKLMVIQNVGYPVPNLSHFRSKEIILTASRSDQVLTSGWMGRYLSLTNPTYPENYPSESFPHPLAITIGNMSSPAFQGNLAEMGVTLQSLSASYQAPGGSQSFPDTPYGNELKFVSEAMEKTGKYLQEVQKAGAAAQNLSSLYPSAGKNSLSDQLKIVARLIAGGLKTPVYMLSLGGFDTHASQVDAVAHETGTHANQLKKVSEAVNAFLDDLTKNNAADKVIGMIFTEFGRRVRSNKSDGTDHGEAFPVLLFGNAVNPVIHGNNPLLNLTMSTNANVPWKTDFRSVYQGILSEWFRAEPADVRDVLQGEFTKVQVLKKSVNIETPVHSGRSRLSVSPNPVSQQTIVSFFSPGGKNRISLLNLNGVLLSAIADEPFPEGRNTVIFHRRNLPAGTYLVMLENKSGKSSVKIVLR